MLDIRVLLPLVLVLVVLCYSISNVRTSSATHTQQQQQQWQRKKKLPPETFIKYPLGIYFQITSHILNFVRFFFICFQLCNARVFLCRISCQYIYDLCVWCMHLSISPYAIFTELPVKFVSTSRLFFNIISRCCLFLALVCLSPRLHSFIIIISVSKNLFFLYFCFFCMIRIVCICMWFLFPPVPHPFDRLIVWITHTHQMPQQEVLEARIAELEDALARLYDKFNQVSSPSIFYNFTFVLHFSLSLSHLFLLPLPDLL